MARQRKAQIIGEVLKYALVGFFSVIIVVAGYKLINLVGGRACKTEIAKFEIDLRGIDKNLRAGEKELQTHYMPCRADAVYFFDLNKTINPDDFRNIPLIRDSLRSKANNNVFVIENGDVKRSFYAGDLEIMPPNYLCFAPKFGKISFFAEGTGASAKIEAADSSILCGNQ